MDIKGLDLDNAPLIAENKAVSYARNILINDNNQSYHNEYGFDQIGNVNLIDGRSTYLCGIIPTNIGFVVFSYIDDINYISYYDNTTGIVLNKRIISTHLNFDNSRPITGDFTYNYKGELIITFTEGIGEEANETRIININNPNGKDPIISETNPFGQTIVTLTEDESTLLKLIPDVIYPTLRFSILESGGLKTGAYQIAIRYKLNDGTYTNYSTLHPTVIITGGANSFLGVGSVVNQSILVEFTDVDSKYEKYQLGIVYIEEEGQLCYQTKDIDLITDNRFVIGNLSGYDTISLEDIMVNTISYIKDAIHVNFNNRLIRGNVENINYSEIDGKLSDLAKTIKITNSYLYDKDVIDTDVKYFKVNEVYSLYAGFYDYKGSLINLYHIPHKAGDSNYPYGDNKDYQIATQNRYLTDPVIFNPTFIVISNTSPQIGIFRTPGNQYIDNVVIYNKESTSGRTLEDGYVPNGHNYFAIYNTNAVKKRLQIEFPLFNIRPADENYYVEIQVYTVDSSERISRLKTIEAKSIHQELDFQIECDINPTAAPFGFYIRVTCNIPFVPVITWPNFNQIRSENVRAYIPAPRIVMLNAEIPNVPDEIKDIVKSYSIFQVEHTPQNSRILSQAIATKDTDRNEFANNQTYLEQFHSRTKARIYPFEYLYNTQTTINVRFKEILHGDAIYMDYIGSLVSDNYKLKGSPGFEEWVGRANIDENVEHFIEPDNDPISPVQRIDYISNNNTGVDNIAGDSYYRYTYDPLSPYDLITDVLDSSAVWYSVAIVDLFNPSETLYVANQNEKLQIISSIYKLNEKATLIGDTYYSYLSLRFTTPSTNFLYGGSDPARQSNSRVWMWLCTLPIESKFNLKARFNKNAIERVFKLHGKGISQLQEWFGIDYTQDNFINTPEGKGYSMIYNENGIENYPILDLSNLITNHKNRIVRSDVLNPESNILSWRHFRPNDYKDLPSNRGEIISLKTDNTNLYIQQKYGLRLASLRDVLSNTAEGSSYLGSSDLFEREPQEILYSPSGYIGATSHYDTTINVFGYYVVDSEKGKIFHVSGTGVSEISAIKCRNWFKRNISKNDNNPFLSRGRYFVANETTNMVQYIQQGFTEFDNMFTISFYPIKNVWVSFHDYIASFGINNRNGVNWFNVESSYANVYGINTNVFGRFFRGIVYDSIFKFILNQDSIQNKLLKNISWLDRVTVRKNSNIEVVDWYDTIDAIAVHNDTQATGFKTVIFDKTWFESRYGVNKANVWRFNNINDISRNPDFLIDQYTFDNTALKQNPKWYDINKFISQFVQVIMKFSNEAINKRYELEEVEAEWIIDNRS